jgi:acetyl esterase/lipase
MANGAAMVICPGGGYATHVIGAEGNGIAAWLNGHGVTGFVLKYRLPKGRPMVPLLDAQRALRLIRFDAKKWEVDSNRVGIIGFSAGGHVASSAGTHFNTGGPDSPDPVERTSCRPDFMILVYPVVTMGANGHAGSRKNLLGVHEAPGLIAYFSNEKHVTRETPPTFLAHATDDNVVPPVNSRELADALKANKVPVKYLELPHGGHGLDGKTGPMWEAWKAASLRWLAELRVIPARDASVLE